MSRPQQLTKLLRSQTAENHGRFIQWACSSNCYCFLGINLLVCVSFHIQNSSLKIVQLADVWVVCVMPSNFSFWSRKEFWFLPRDAPEGKLQPLELELGKHPFTHLDFWHFCSHCLLSVFFPIFISHLFPSFSCLSQSVCIYPLCFPIWDPFVSSCPLFAHFCVLTILWLQESYSLPLCSIVKI